MVGGGHRHPTAALRPTEEPVRTRPDRTPILNPRPSVSVPRWIGRPDERLKRSRQDAQRYRSVPGFAVLVHSAQ